MKQRNGLLACALALVAWLLAAGVAHAQKPFVIKWHVDTPNATIKLPIEGENYKLAWGKVGAPSTGTTVKTKTTPQMPHELKLTEAGDYLIEIGPDGVTKFQMKDPNGPAYSDVNALLEVVSWGDVKWTDMMGAFAGCANLVLGADAGKPDLAAVKSMQYMFKECKALNQPVDHWDVSHVENMMGLFESCVMFNQPLASWNASNVKQMGSMFSGCKAFDQPLEAWDVSKVESMMAMFQECSEFNQSLEAWGPKTKSLKDLSRMFYNCAKFNGSLKGWDVSRVVNFGSVFQGCTNFNQPLNDWDVSSAEYTGHMFEMAVSFNQPLDSWKMGKVQLAVAMFYGCKSFNQPLNDWDMKSATQLTGMFEDCEVFNQPLDKWDVSKVRDMDVLFSKCKSFNQSLAAWKLHGLDPRTAKIGLDYCGMSRENYDATLAAWAADDKTAKNIAVKAAGLKYGCKSEAHKKLIDEKKWQFIGDESTCFTIEGKNVIAVGEKTTLTAKFDASVPEAQQKIKWSDDGKGVVNTEPNTGIVEGKKPGDATVFAEWEGETRSVLMKVVEPLKSLRFANAELHVDVSESDATASVIPDPPTAAAKLAWSVEPKDVVELNPQGGTTCALKPLKTGRAVITVKSNGLNADPANPPKAECVVFVDKLPTKLTLKQHKLTLHTGAQPGKPEKLIVEFEPQDVTNKDVRVETDPMDVVEVSDDLEVKPLKVGKTKVTVYAKHDKTNTIKDECEVEVLKAVEKVTLEPAELMLKVDGAAGQLTAKVEPADADQKLTWTMNPEGIVTVDEMGKVTPVKAGKTTITVTAHNGLKAESQVTVTQDVKQVILPEEIILPLGGSPEKIMVKVLPEDATNKELTWSVENGSIVTVNGEGVITPLAVGTTTITAKAHNGVEAKCRVEVKQPVPATGVTMSQTELTMSTEDAPVTITAKVEPGNAQSKDVTWSVEPAGIVTVDGGKITAVKAGKATVIATAHNGVKGECKVTVTQPAKEVQLTPNELTLTMGGEPGTLTAKVLPADATDMTITWSVEPEGIVTVADGKVTAVKIGQAKVIATAHNGVKAECQVTVKEAGAPTPNPQPKPNPNPKPNTSEVEVLHEVTVAPNPFGAMLTVRNALQVQRYELVNVSGTVIAAGRNSAEMFTLSTSHLPQGVYVLRLHGTEGIRGVLVTKF